MNTPNPCFRIPAVLALAILPVILLTGCNEPLPGIGTPSDEVTPSEESTQGYTEQLKELYEKAKDAGEQVPEDVYEWARADMKKMGTWEYKIVTLPQDTPENIEAALNALGSEKWECYWVEQTGEGTRFYFKKPVRSYLQMVGKASSLLPMPSGSGGE